jgi:hypothetical protein
MEAGVDAFAELVCVGFLTFYSLFLLALVAAPALRNRRLGLTNRRQQTGGQEPEELIPGAEDGAKQRRT